MAFTTYVHFEVGPLWPRGYQYTFRHGDAAVRLSGQADGRLVVEGPGGNRTTQPVLVRHYGNVTLTLVALDEQPCELYFLAEGGERRLDDSDEAFEIAPNPPPPDRLLSIHHPEARKLCAARMATRASEHTPPAAPCAGKRLRTAAEDFQLLLEQRQIVQTDLVQAARGEGGRLQVVQGSLRAMLYAPAPAPKPQTTPRRSNWNPLLFRCAAALDMPLPVWGIRPSPVPLSLMMDYRAPASIPPRFPGERLVDLQESLSWPLLKLDAPHTCERIDANMFVLKRGSADGLAHVDPEIPT